MVKNKCQSLFRQWAVAYQSTPGMERIVALHKQLPKRKKPVSQAQSRVLQETEREANEDPFGNDDQEPAPTAGGPTTLSSGNSNHPPHSSWFEGSKHSKKPKEKKHKYKTFNLEKEKPQLLEAIASSSVASTNLMNSLKLLNREHVRVSEHAETVNRFETCKALRLQILRYIQFVESEQWLGSLINANDGLVEALMAYEILDKSVDEDSDSESNEWDDVEASNKPIRPEPAKDKSVQEAFTGLNIAQSSTKDHPVLLLNGDGGINDAEDGDSEEDNENNPFADINAVHTPKRERPGMTWYVLFANTFPPY